MVSENKWSFLNTNGKKYNCEGDKIPTTVAWDPGPDQEPETWHRCHQGSSSFEALPSASLRYCNCAVLFWWRSGYRTWTELLSVSGILSFWEGSNKLHREPCIFHWPAMCHMATLRFMGVKRGVVAFYHWRQQDKELSRGMEGSVQNHLPGQKSEDSVWCQ